MYDLAGEKNYWRQGYQLVAGLDEAGRGPLAGPVVAACVACPAGTQIKNKSLLSVKDSKKLTAKKREELFSIIIEEFPAVGIGICDHSTIDRINILEASFLAMKKALGALREKPDFIMLDGKFPLPNFSLPQQPIINGDQKIFSIAAASIIAKVTRDRIMLEMDSKYPVYGFAQHKGYGTKAHLEALSKHGPSPIHRLSFQGVLR